MYPSIDEKHIIFYEHLPVDGKWIVVIIDLETLNKIGEFLVDGSTFSNKDLLQNDYSYEWYARERW